MINTENMKVVFLGCTSNYGYGFSANVTKVGYMAKGLIEAGAECSIHNGIIGNKFVNKEEKIVVDNIPVTSLRKRGNEFISWIFNIGKIHKYLKSERNANGKNIAIIEWDMYHIFLIYHILCKINNYKLIAICHEWGPIVLGVHKLRKPSVYLYAKTFGWFVDGILPISEYIINKIKKFNTPYIKLPILAEFNKLELQNINDKHKYFVYCASVLYKRIIIEIIDAYAIYKKNEGKIRLHLILNGADENIMRISEYIQHVGLQDNIIVMTKLPYKNLIKEYCNAEALIIPLDPNCEQDEARFSQKIAEYLSSKSPIITNDVGEIKYYFNSNEVIKCDYTKEAFAEKFRWVEEYPENSKIIGLNGYNKGVKEFDYKTNGVRLFNFFKIL